MSLQLQVEVLTEANELATQELDDMQVIVCVREREGEQSQRHSTLMHTTYTQVQMTRMMAHTESDRALLEEQVMRLCSFSYSSSDAQLLYVHVSHLS